jgi:hypothetical protein
LGDGELAKLNRHGLRSTLFRRERFVGANSNHHLFHGGRRSIPGQFSAAPPDDGACAHLLVEMASFISFFFLLRNFYP